MRRAFGPWKCNPTGETSAAARWVRAAGADIDCTGALRQAGMKRAFGPWKRNPTGETSDAARWVRAAGADIDCTWRVAPGWYEAGLRPLEAQSDRETEG